jgi:hypothetical protein
LQFIPLLQRKRAVEPVDPGPAATTTPLKMARKIYYHVYTHLDEHGMWWRCAADGRRVSSLTDKFEKVMAQRFQPEKELYCTTSPFRQADNEAPR